MSADVSPARLTAERINVLGIGISAINLQQATSLVLDAVRKKTRGYICVAGVHGVMESQDDPDLARIINRGLLCTPDGMPMVWMGWLQGYRHVSRVYGPDLMIELCEASAGTEVRHFLYGGGPGVAERLKECLLQRFPGLRIVGVYEPPFRPLNAKEEEDLRSQVSAARPDIMWVGLSTPKQERFMAEYLSKLDVTIMLGVGAAFDFHSGRVRQAPRWVQRSGFEWLFRLGQEPRRLWRRYLRHNPRFVCRVAGQVTGLRRFPLRES